MNPNSAFYWLPRVADLDAGVAIATPRSHLIPIDFMDAIGVIEGERPARACLPMESLHAAAADLGLPVFVRSDLKSAKHQGEPAMVAWTPDQLASVCARVLASNVQTMHRPAGLCLRERLDLEVLFHDGGTPIAREFRVFASDESADRIVPYWPVESIDEPDVEPATARELLADAQVLLDEERSYLAAAAVAAAGACPAADAWSVDFAVDDAGRWWLIDMARREDSWEPEADQTEVGA
jgi:carbamoylphosphate synthase large subunit